jgi:hypothetical protein
MSVANKSVDKGTKHYHLYNNDGNRIELEQSDGEKDIGVFVDENLSFNTHIQNKVNKANSIMGLIRRTYTYLDEQSFKYLFQALVRPHIEYAEAVSSSSCYAPLNLKLCLAQAYPLLLEDHKYHLLF